MKAPTKRAGIYARIATPPQSPQLNPLQVQIMHCRSYCEQKGYQILDEHIYQEVFSGAGYTNRPELTRLRTAAKQGEIDVLMVFAYDRISRKQDLVTAFLAELESFGVLVESVTQASPESLSLVDQMGIYARTDAREKTPKLRGK